jgi:hypothetical protein
MQRRRVRCSATPGPRLRPEVHSTEYPQLPHRENLVAFEAPHLGHVQYSVPEPEGTLRALAAFSSQERHLASSCRMSSPQDGHFFSGLGGSDGAITCPSPGLAAKARRRPNGPSSTPRPNQTQPLLPFFLATTALTTPKSSHARTPISMCGGPQSQRRTVGRSASSRASEPSGPSESEDIRVALLPLDL